MRFPEKEHRQEPFLASFFAFFSALFSFNDFPDFFMSFFVDSPLSIPRPIVSPSGTGTTPASQRPFAIETEPGLQVKGRPYSSLLRSTARKAFWGMATEPTIFIFRLPSFCFSSSLRLRVMSPP